MLTVEQIIVDALITRLQTISAIKAAYDGRVTPFNDTELPAANVFTPESAADSTGPGRFDHDLKVTIVLYVAERTAQKAIRALVGDVYAAIGTDDTLGVPQIISINDPTKGVKCIQQGDFIGSAQVALTINYRTARWAI
jgi:hypothetical protein